MDKIKYIPTEEDIREIREDWLGGERQKDTFVHRNSTHSISRSLSDEESLSDYAFGRMSDKDTADKVEVIRRARNIADAVVNTMTPERVKVTVGGKDSYSYGRCCRNNANSINVATDFFDRNDLSIGRKTDILIGESVHEAAHILHSDFQRLNDECEKWDDSEKRIRKYINNVLEDERVEYLVGEDMSGMADYIAVLKQHMCANNDVNDMEENESAGPLEKFTRAFWNCIRYPGELTDEDIIENYDYLSRVRAVCQPFPKTTDEVFAATDAIIGIMKDLIEEEMKPKMPEDQPDDRNSEDSDEGQAQDSPQPSQKDIDDAFKQALGSESLNSLLDAMEKEMNSTGEGGKESSVLRNHYDATDYANGDAEKTVVQGAGHSEIAYIRKIKGNPQKYNEALSSVKSLVPSVRKILSCRAEDSDYTLQGMKRGKLNTNKFVSLRTGNRNVFSRHGEITTEGACVCILIDESGSMSGAREAAAREAAVLVNEAVNGIDNLEVFVYGFTDNEFNVYCERNATDRYGIGSTKSLGGTPTGQAMQIAGERVRKLTKTNCLMLVMTDGMPDECDAVREQDMLLRKKGFYPIGIGIDSSSTGVANIFMESLVITDLKDFAPRLGRFAKKYMSKIIVREDSLD